MGRPRSFVSGKREKFQVLLESSLISVSIGSEGV